MLKFFKTEKINLEQTTLSSMIKLRSRSTKKNKSLGTEETLRIIKEDLIIVNPLKEVAIEKEAIPSIKAETNSTTIISAGTSEIDLRDIEYSIITLALLRS